MIHLIQRQRKISLDASWLKDLTKELLLLVDRSSYELTILLTTNRTIARYNKQYRNKKGPTDILSFSYQPQFHDPEELILGDLILSVEYINDYCHKENISFEHRLMVLVIHGICHLLGHDHENDQDYALMNRLERKLIASLPASLRR